jgi:putative hydrolase of the HAD superfamily
MAIDVSRIRAVVFDYGNTLIPFTPDHLKACGDAFAQVMRECFGPFDEAAYADFRARSRRAPFEGASPTYLENDLPKITFALVEELYGKTPSEDEMIALMMARLESFVGAVESESWLEPLLARLASRWPLGLLSNYPDGPAIRASLDKIGITKHFKSIVISGELGYCKPHPLAFAASLKELGVAAPEVLFVGDNWLADVQGAKRVGMQMVRIQAWHAPEEWPSEPEDLQPDAVLESVEDLESLLD